MRYLFIIAFIALSAAGSISAASLAQVRFLGFSPGGDYAAFGQYWIEDGSGFPGAEIRVMSVTEGEPAEVFQVIWTEEMIYGEDGRVELDDGGNPAWTTVLDQACPCLDSLGITGEHMGRHCLCHLLTDRGSDPYRASFVTWMGSPIYMGPEYSMNLLLHPPALENPPEWLTMFDEPVLLELVIEDRDGCMVMHHRDADSAQDYEYVSDYRIRDVFVFADSMTAVILNTTGPGFEGPDGMFRMVTGVLDIDPGLGY